MKLNFSPIEGFYYLSRPIGSFNYEGAKDMLEQPEHASMYSDAMKMKHCVVCFPIPVRMVENLDLAIRNVMQHLKRNDMLKMGATKEDRVRSAETYFDNQKEEKISASKRDDMRAYGREHWRDYIQTKSFVPKELE